MAIPGPEGVFSALFWRVAVAVAVGCVRRHGRCMPFEPEQAHLAWGVPLFDSVTGLWALYPHRSLPVEHASLAPIELRQ